MHTYTHTRGRTFLINEHYKNKEMESVKVVLANMLRDAWYNSCSCFMTGVYVTVLLG